MADFNPGGALQILARHGVDFVVIGGVAANALGSPLLTLDLDVCHSRDADNLERLAGALREMNATLRGAPPGLPFLLDALTLHRGDSFTFTTDVGDVDILATPSGTEGFGDLKRNALTIEVADGLFALVCSLDDLMRMKRAAGRNKDLIALEELGALRDEIEGKPERDDSHLYGEGRRRRIPPA